MFYIVAGAVVRAFFWGFLACGGAGTLVFFCTWFAKRYVEVAVWVSAVNDTFGRGVTSVAMADDGWVFGIDWLGESVIEDVACSFEGTAIGLLSIAEDAAIKLVDISEALLEQICAGFIGFYSPGTDGDNGFIFVWKEFG